MQREGFPTVHRAGATPVPIPNTEVKPRFGDGTAHFLGGRVARRWDFLGTAPEVRSDDHFGRRFLWRSVLRGDEAVDRSHSGADRPRYPRENRSSPRATFSRAQSAPATRRDGLRWRPPPIRKFIWRNKRLAPTAGFERRRDSASHFQPVVRF